MAALPRWDQRLRMLEDAPEDDEPLTDEDIKALESNDPGISLEEFRRELGE